MKEVISIRDKALPIIDTKIKFGMPPIELSANTSILVLEVKIESEVIQLGAIVDSVHEVLEINGNHILPPPGLGAKYKSRFISGIVKQDDKFIMLIDLDSVFNDDDLEFSKNELELIEA